MQVILLILVGLLSSGCERIVYRSLPVAQDATAEYYLSINTGGEARSVANLVGYGHRAGASGALALMRGADTLYTQALDGEHTTGYRLVADQELGRLELREISCTEAIRLWPALGACPPALSADHPYRVVWSGALPDG